MARPQRYPAHYFEEITPGMRDALLLEDPRLCASARLMAGTLVAVRDFLKEQPLDLANMTTEQIIEHVVTTFSE